MKRKFLVVIPTLIVIMVICSVPRPLVGDSYQLDYVEYAGKSIRLHDESFKAKREELESILRSYSRCAVPMPFTTWAGDTCIRLTGGDGRRPLHIILSDGSGSGKRCYRLYSSAEKGGYPIWMGEDLRLALEKALADE